MVHNPMTVDGEIIVERRRMRRRVTFWRVVAAIVGVLAILFASTRGNLLSGGVGGEQVARVKVHGIISDDRDLLELLDRIAANEQVRALLVDVNSPGGTTTGGEAIFTALRRVADKKPVVAVFGTVAASAGYIVGLACDRIVSRGNTITGSVGVIFQWAEVHQLLDKLGVKVNEVKSGPLKASPSMFEPVDERSRAVMDEMVEESQAWFLNLVRERRGIDPASVRGLVEGRIYSGRQAEEFKLVDQIGGEREAMDWLVAEHGLDEEIPVKDWKKKDEGLWDLAGVARALFAAIGFEAFDEVPGARALERLKLDGLVSVWHAHPSK